MTKPFFSIALQAGANSVWLNPDNKGQDRISTYIGKPVRATARAVYCIACLTIIPAIGSFYHLLMAVDNFCYKRNMEKTVQSLKNLGQDLIVAAVTIFSIYISILGFNNLGNTSNNFGYGAGFFMVPAIPISQFIFSPDDMKNLSNINFLNEYF